MFLYLNEYGYKVSKKKEFLEVEHPNGETEIFNIRDLTAAYFAGEGRISKAIMIELTKRNIDTILLARSGKPLVYIYPAHTKPKSLKIIEKQMNLDNKTEKHLIRLFVLKAIRSKSVVLNELYRSRKRTNKEVAKTLLHYRNKIRGVEKKAKKFHRKDCGEFRSSLRGYEGFSAKMYFEVLKYVIPNKFNYIGLRTRRPPTDLFNSAISYGYSHLNYFIEKALLLNGINPYYGYLHKQADKTYQFLTFDMMEGFRHTFIDKTILNLIARRRLAQEKHCKTVKNGIFLNKYGKRMVSKAIYSSYFSKFRKQIYRDVKQFASLL